MTVNEKGFEERRRHWLVQEASACSLDAEPFIAAVAAHDTAHKGGFGSGYTLTLAKSIQAYLRAAYKDAEPVAWQYRYWYSSGEPGVWLSERRKDADDLLESGVLIREETRALFTFQPDALVHVDGVTMTPTAAANRIAELSAAQADHSTAIEPVAASPGVPEPTDDPTLQEAHRAARECITYGIVRATRDWHTEPEQNAARKMAEELLETFDHYLPAHLFAPASPEPSPASEDVLREALRMIADICDGSTTANSLPHIGKMAREALRA